MNIDLDDIKKIWKEHKDHSPDQIKVNLDKLVQSKYHNTTHLVIKKLIQTEWNIIMVVAILFPVYILFFTQLSRVNIYTYIAATVFIITMIATVVHNLYKIKLLKKIDITKDTIMQTSVNINKYKKRVLAEIYIGIAVTPLVLPSVLILTGTMYDLNINKHNITLSVLILLLTAIITWLVYKYLYTNRIKTLQNTIKEIESFKNEN